MKKRVLAVAASFIASIGLVACSGASSTNSATGTSSSGKEEAAVTTAAGDAADTAEDAEKAAEWPASKTINIICPASAGGATDSAARIWASYLTEAYKGTNFIVQNDNTGNGTVAMEKVRNSKNTDGSDLLFYNTGMLLANHTGAYDYSLFDDFKFITIGFTTTPDGFELCVPADSKYTNMQDLVDDMKSNPGTLITGIQNGSTRQFLAGAMKAATDTDFKMVDTGSEADTITALLGGNINFAFIQPSNAKQYIENGDLKALAICQDERSENYPDIPTTKEQGYDNINVNSYQLVVGPKDMSDATANAIAETMKGYAENATVADTLGKMNVKYTYTSREDCLKMVQDADKVYTDAAKAIGY